MKDEREPRMTERDETEAKRLLREGPGSVGAGYRMKNLKKRYPRQYGRLSEGRYQERLFD